MVETDTPLGLVGAVMMRVIAMRVRKSSHDPTDALGRMIPMHAQDQRFESACAMCADNPAPQYAEERCAIGVPGQVQAAFHDAHMGMKSGERSIEDQHGLVMTGHDERAMSFPEVIAHGQVPEALAATIGAAVVRPGERERSRREQQGTEDEQAKSSEHGKLSR